MGLDVTHGCWSGPYSAFNRWREAIEGAAGITATHLAAFLGVTEERLATDRAAVPESILCGEWEQDPPDVLFILSLHHDCDGIIPLRFCAPLAERLEGLLPLLPQDDVPGLPHGLQARTQRFVDGLRSAASRGDDVRFC